MSVLDSLFVGVFGMAVVFIVLVGLSLLLRLQSSVVNRFSKRQPVDAFAEDPESIFPGHIPELIDESLLHASQTTAACDASAKKYIVKVNDSIFEVNVGRTESQLKQETVDIPRPNLSPIASVVHAPPTVPSAPKTASPATNRANIVAAPIPGTIVEIKTTVGAKVLRGDILIILDAMKMENEIVAAKDGTITKIMTAIGASVKTGTPLIEMQ